MLEDTQQELRKEREEGKRKQEELEIAENEVKRLKTLLKHEDAL